MTDIGFVAACPYVVVVRKVYIENQFFGNRAKGLGFREGLSIPRVGIIDWPDLEAGRVKAEDVFAEAGMMFSPRSIADIKPI